MQENEEELNLGTADACLVSLWRELAASEENDAREWLENALHDRLAKVKIADGLLCPNQYLSFKLR